MSLCVCFKWVYNEDRAAVLSYSSLVLVCVCERMLPVLAGRLHGHHEKREQHGVDGA